MAGSLHLKSAEALYVVGRCKEIKKRRKLHQTAQQHGTQSDAECGAGVVHGRQSEQRQINTVQQRAGQPEHGFVPPKKLKQR